MSRPPFTMSKYVNSHDLHRDAHKYYKNISESLEQSIIKACEKVGKDSDGKFPFNAFDLAERILKLESTITKVVSKCPSCGHRKWDSKGVCCLCGGE